MTVRRLHGLDAVFLYLETPSQHMHVTATMVLEPVANPDNGADDGQRATAVTETLLHRLGAEDAFRRRVVDAPLGIAHPAWIDAGHFDPREHARRLTLPAPGTMEQLAEAVGRIAAEPLDRRHPLWQLWTIDGLAGGRIGVALKVHHAMLDGVAGLGVLGRLFTSEPTFDSVTPARKSAEDLEEPTALGMAGWALLAALHAPASVAKTLLHTARAVGPLVRGAIERAAASVPTVLPFSAPRSLLNQALTPARVVAFGRVPLASVKEIKCAYGVTVNDVVLTACTRALGDYLRAHDQPPTRPIVASVPVSEHGGDDADSPSNRVSVMFVGLPVHLTSNDEIVAFIHAQAAGAKRIYASFGPMMLADWAELTPPALFAAAAGLYSWWQLADRLPPPHSVVISNVPGPPVPLFVGALRLVAAYPLGPVLEGAGVNISVVSYAGSIDIGLVACPRMVAEPFEITRGFEDSIATLLALVRARAA